MGINNTASRVVDAKCIESIVAMVPLDQEAGDGDNEDKEDMQYSDSGR